MRRKKRLIPQVCNGIFRHGQKCSLFLRKKIFSIQLFMPVTDRFISKADITTRTAILSQHGWDENLNLVRTLNLFLSLWPVLFLETQTALHLALKRRYRTGNLI